MRFAHVRLPMVSGSVPTMSLTGFTTPEPAYMLMSMKHDLFTAQYKSDQQLHLCTPPEDRLNEIESTKPARHATGRCSG